MIRIQYFFNFLIFIAVSACTYDQLNTPADCSLGPTLNVSETLDANCNQTDGRILVQATGGVGELTFQLNDGEFQSNPSFEGLAAGTYNITVKDENNCTSTQQAQINNLDGVNIQLVVEDAGCASNQGSITIETFGGEAPFEFALNDGNFQSSNVFNGLSSGSFNVSARDANGCVISQSVNLTSGISFQATIRPIIESNCALPNCHGGTQFPDLRTYENIRAQSNRIRIRTSNRSMPVGGLRLSDQQIEAISCWVEDGAPNN